MHRLEKEENIMIPDSIAPLRKFVVDMTELVEHTNDEAILLKEGEELLARLIAGDDWLPEAFTRPDPQYYQQYLLYCDPFERFCVVSFVWGPNQGTPVHDHTIWGLVGILSGSEREVRYALNPARGDSALRVVGDAVYHAGDIQKVSPSIGDIHAVSNALVHEPSISIHVYGGNIGATPRHVYDPVTGQIKPFVSGYSSMFTPNLWDKSAQIRENFKS